VLTHSAKEEDLRRALSAGAKGYLLKGAEPEQVCETIREVFAGKSSLPRELAAKLADSIAQPKLSERELQILKLMALGKRRSPCQADGHQREHFLQPTQSCS
jgi:two-component system, NarL family, response regulator